jgi:hypothetical protein
MVGAALLRELDEGATATKTEMSITMIKSMEASI